MKSSQAVKPAGMQTPGIYRIQVQGELDAGWADRLNGMNITEASGPNCSTILVGRLKDQTALSGILNTLYEMHLPVISVDCLENG